ncbi:transporter substrate-binding domain-containing protein [Bacteroidales bacterium OttesenSCG-928-M11]|nr:transporter substrate-binding domain-containing protein [Bacteroidales bacterium OttesenSCG-928-M11]
MKKPLWKYTILLIVILAIILGFMFYLRKLMSSETNDAPRDYHEIKNNGILNIITEYNSLGYYVSGDSISGLQYELSQYIAKQANIEVNIILENNLAKSIEQLLSREVDIIARNIPITNDNKEFLSFTVPLSLNKQVLIQRKFDENNPDIYIDNQIHLGNKQVYVPKDASAILRLKNLSEEIAEPIYIEEEVNYTAEQLIYRVVYKDIDYAVVDYGIALKNIEEFPEIDINTDISFTQLQSWAVRQESTILLDSLNSWITKWKESH